MARFLNHEPCPKCGSRDNLAVYDDGSAWCFGCRYYRHPLRRIPSNIRSRAPKQAYFNDWVAELPPLNRAWLEQYGLSEQEISSFRYSGHYDRHIYAVCDSSGEVIFFEARSVSQQPKALSHGEKPIHFPCQPVSRTTTRTECIVVVEDLVSAIRVGRHVPCIPLWGSSLSKDWYPYLKGLTHNIIFWLDNDKYPEAIKQARLAGLYGFGTRVIRTEKDPKELTDTEIIEALE